MVINDCNAIARPGGGGRIWGWVGRGGGGGGVRGGGGGEGRGEDIYYLVAGVEDTLCLHSFPSSSHSLGGRMLSRISSVSVLSSQ